VLAAWCLMYFLFYMDRVNISSLAPVIGKELQLNAFQFGIVFSAFGWSLRAGRDSELRAEATGVDVRRQKWIAFTLAGAFAGMAGGLMVYLKGSAFPSYFDIATSFDVFVMALLGGLQSLNGPIVGAGIYRFLKTMLQTYIYHWNMIVGAILILLALFMPRGVSGVLGSLRDWRLRSRAVPGAVAVKAAE